MGNYRFRLSAMMPNAWFYKLKDMSKTSPHNNNSNSSPNPFKPKKMHPTTTTTISSSPSHHHQTLQPRKSYYFTREQHTPAPSLKPDYLPNSPINPKISDVPFPESPRKSTRRRSSRRRRIRNNIKSSSTSSATTTTTTKFVNSSVSAGCSCRATLESVWATKSDSIPYYSSPPDSVSPSPHHQCSPDEFDSNRNEATTDISEGGGPASSWSSTTTTTTAATTTTCSCRISPSTTDIVIEDVDTKKSSSSSSTTSEKFEKVDEFDTISEIELPPILTKPQKYIINQEKKETTQPMTKPPPRRSSSNGGSSSSSSLLSVKVIKKETMKSSNNTLKDQKISPMMNRRCSSTGSPGLKLRAKILASRKIQACSSKKTAMPSGTAASTSLMRSRKKNISDSFAIIKSSLDPQRDFKESMVEMIVENNLRASKDLEELLACYLSLNSNEYHDLIVEVFQQIWFDLTDIRL